MEIIEQNPYRIIGVLSNSSKKEIVANSGKIKAFAKTGKTISFENDFSSILKPVIRTEESSAKANSAITLPKDKLSAGLFWFMQETNLDEIALNHLRKGDIDNSITVLRKKPTVSSCINLAILNLIKSNWDSALYYYVYLLNDKEKRTELLSIIADNPEILSEKEVVQVFVDKLIMSFPKVSWMEVLNKKEVLISDKLYDIKDFFAKSNVYDCFSQRISELSVKRLNLLLENAASVDGYNANKNLEAAKTLADETKFLLRSLRACLGKDNHEYTVYCDKVANQILDNCIDYYNHDKDNPIRARNIIQLLRYALRTAEGRIAKDRCKNNYDHIKQECDALLPIEIEKEVNYINKQIAEFKRLSKISNYSGYLNGTIGACYQKLVVIKTKVGPNSPHYINASSNVVLFGIDIIIDEVNRKKKAYDEASEFNGDKELLELRNALKWGKSIFEVLRSFAKNLACIERYKKNIMYFFELYDRYSSENIEVPKKRISPRTYTLNVSAPSVIKEGVPFRIDFTINSTETREFIMPELKGFELLNDPSVSIANNTTKYSCVLKANYAGLFIIQSASVKIGSRVIKSPERTIRVLAKSPETDYDFKESTASKHSESPNSSNMPNADKNHNDISTTLKWVLGVILFFVFMVIAIIKCVPSPNDSVLDSMDMSVSSANQVENLLNNDNIESEYSIDSTSCVEDTPSQDEIWLESYEGNSLSTGATPYKSKYGNNSKSGNAALKVKAPISCDILVIVKNTKGNVVRHAYIKAGQTYSFTLRAGTYQPFFVFGNSWCPEKKAPNGEKGYFLEDVSISKDYPQEIGEYQALEYTLQAVQNGNFNTVNSNSNEAF